MLFLCVNQEIDLRSDALDGIEDGTAIENGERSVGEEVVL
jgi:hypothetical protein